MSKSLFGPEARERLMTIDAVMGAQRFQRLEDFAAIAVRYSGTPLVVPPDIDQDMHEVLSARNRDGKGLETQRIEHLAVSILGDTRGKTLSQIDHALAIQTVALCRREGLEIGDSTYTVQACTLTVLEV